MLPPSAQKEISEAVLPTPSQSSPQGSWTCCHRAGSESTPIGLVGVSTEKRLEIYLQTDAERG